MKILGIEDVARRLAKRLAPMRAAEGPCREGPDRCMDDLCRGQDVGMCGAVSDSALGIYDDDDEWDDWLDDWLDDDDEDDR